MSPPLTLLPTVNGVKLASLDIHFLFFRFLGDFGGVEVGQICRVLKADQLAREHLRGVPRQLKVKV